MIIPNLIVNLSEDDIQNYPLIQNNQLSFYRFLVQRVTGFPYSKETVSLVDCTKIHASKQLIDTWEKVAVNDGMDIADFSMLMLTHGPKLRPTLKDHQVLLEPSAIILTDNSRYPQALMIL